MTQINEAKVVELANQIAMRLAEVEILSKELKVLEVKKPRGRVPGTGKICGNIFETHPKEGQVKVRGFKTPEDTRVSVIAIAKNRGLKVKTSYIPGFIKYKVIS